MGQSIPFLLTAEDQSYFDAEPDGRLKCTLNGHIFPASGNDVAAFLSGKKYQRLRRLAEEQKSLCKYEPFLVQSRNYEDKLFCALTCRLVNKRLEMVRRHLKGKTFLKAKEKYENESQDLMLEPDLEAEEASASHDQNDAEEEILMASDSDLAEAMEAQRLETNTETAAVDQPMEKQDGGTRPRKKRKTKAKETVPAGEAKKANDQAEAMDGEKRSTKSKQDAAAPDQQPMAKRKAELAGKDARAAKRRQQ